MSYNKRLKETWPENEAQRRVLELLAPRFTASELVDRLGFENDVEARRAIDALRNRAFNIENDRATGTFGFYPVPK